MVVRAGRTILTCTAALCLSGCDIFYGVMRDAELDTHISLDCVRHAIETTPGVVEVEYREDHNGKGLFHPTPWVYSYLYRGTPESHIVGVLQIYKDYEDRFSYGNSLFYINRKPPQADIDATRPVMKAIEVGLAAQCGITELPARVKETCQGVVCAPM